MLKTFGSHVRGNVVGYIALFVALGGTTYAATGGNFILGNPNSASSTTSLSAPIAGKALQLTNTSTGAGATALGLNVASGHPPFTVNSGAKVANLNADKLDGLDSTGFIRGRKLDQNLSRGGPLTKLATVGPYDINGKCEAATSSGTRVRISAEGPAGTADAMFSKTENDNTDLGNESTGLLISANVDTEFASITDVFLGYRRIGGTAMLRSGGSLVQVDFIGTAINGPQPGQGSCFVYGTATMAT